MSPVGISRIFTVSLIGAIIVSSLLASVVTTQFFKSVGPQGPQDRSIYLTSDNTVSLSGPLVVYDPTDLSYDKDRNVLWMASALGISIAEINATSMTVMNKVSFPNADNETYHVIYDGSYVWASTSPDNPVGIPASIIRLNPNDLSYVAYTFPNDIQHMNGAALAVAYDIAGKEYVFIGLGGNTTSPASWLYRFDPSNFPSLSASVNLRYGSYYPTLTRAIVFAGNNFGNNRVYCACDGGWFFGVDIDSMQPTYLGKPTNHSVFSGAYDGSYIWWGDSAGEVLRMNPTTYSVTTMKLELGSGRVHDWAVCPNGYLWTIDYDAGHAYIINAATMEYNILNMTLVDPHAVEYDGTYVWIADNTTETATPLPIARLSRFKWNVPIRKFEQGLTNTFAIDSASNVNVTVTFDKPFAAVPIVVVGLNQISDNTAIIVNVQAVNVTRTGFICSCVVSTTGHAGSTARFSWLATSRYEDIPS